MVGANYMGGKRNMAKSRSKDWTGKAQKNHFGTQRIAVLQKGLSGTSQHQSVLNTTSSGPSAINLGHMARDSDLMGSQQPSSTDCPMVLPHMSPSHTTAMDASHANSDQESMKHISKSILALDALGGSSFRTVINEVLRVSTSVGLRTFRGRRNIAANMRPKRSVCSQKQGKTPDFPQTARTHASVSQEHIPIIPKVVNVSTLPPSSDTRSTSTSSRVEPYDDDSGYAEDGSSGLGSDRLALHISTSLSERASPGAYLHQSSGEGFHEDILEFPSPIPFDILEFPISPVPHREHNTPPCTTNALDYSFPPDRLFARRLASSNNRHSLPPQSPVAQGIGGDMPEPEDPSVEIILLEEVLHDPDPWNAVGELMSLPPIDMDTEYHGISLHSQDFTRKGVGWNTPTPSLDPPPVPLTTPPSLPTPSAHSMHTGEQDDVDYDMDIDELLGFTDIIDSPYSPSRSPATARTVQSLYLLTPIPELPPTHSQPRTDDTLSRIHGNASTPTELVSPAVHTPSSRHLNNANIHSHRFDLDIDALFAEVAPDLTVGEHTTANDPSQAEPQPIPAPDAVYLRGPCLFSNDSDAEEA